MDNIINKFGTLKTKKSLNNYYEKEMLRINEYLTLLSVDATNYNESIEIIHNIQKQLENIKTNVLNMS